MRDQLEAMTVRISGRVQGVGFRVWVQTEAGKLGLTGWVRNEDDGSVTALIVGAHAAVSAMMEKLRSGPPGASVSGVASEKSPTSPQRPTGFRIAGSR